VAYGLVRIPGVVSLSGVLRGSGESEVEEHYVQPDNEKNEDSC